MLLSALLLAFQTAAGPAGHWQGTIAIPDREIGITVDLDKTKEGVWIGSVSVSMSTAIDVPLTGITIEGASIRFSASLPGKTTFAGTLATTGRHLSGQVSNPDGSVPFTLERKGDADVKRPPPSTALPPELAGTWEGDLVTGGKTIRAVVTLSRGAGGIALATLVSSAGGVTQDIPISTVTIEDKDVTLESRAVSGTFRGTITPDGAIAGEWSQPNARVPLTLRRAKAGQAGAASGV